mmetsp:Transcript_13673/g.29755  ORF Transcript_13673/g.29755 Transcript_13673/m.29755 type:complete len:207 (-) Transcript_13673:170-790(-)
MHSSRNALLTLSSLAAGSSRPASRSASRRATNSRRKASSWIVPPYAQLHSPSPTARTIPARAARARPAAVRGRSSSPPSSGPPVPPSIPSPSADLSAFTASIARPPLVPPPSAAPMVVHPIIRPARRLLCSLAHATRARNTTAAAAADSPASIPDRTVQGALRAAGEDGGGPPERGGRGPPSSPGAPGRSSISGAAAAGSRKGDTP